MKKNISAYEIIIFVCLTAIVVLQLGCSETPGSVDPDPVPPVAMISISTQPSVVTAHKEIKFSVSIMGLTDVSGQFNWSLGDGTSYQSVSDSVIYHTYTATGFYLVTVELVDTSGSVILADSLTLDIAAIFAPINVNAYSITLSGDLGVRSVQFNKETGDTLWVGPPDPVKMVPFTGWRTKSAVTWTGDTLLLQTSLNDTSSAIATYCVVVFADDGNSIESIYSTWHGVLGSHLGGVVDSVDTVFEAVDIPISAKVHPDSAIYIQTGIATKTSIRRIFNRWASEYWRRNPLEYNWSQVRWYADTVFSYENLELKVRLFNEE